jgi:hypothetical protein
MPSKRGTAKPKKTAKKKSPGKKSISSAPKKTKVTGPLTVVVRGKRTLANVQKAIRTALQQYKTDIFADSIDNTLQITLQHQVGPRPLPCPPFCPDEDEPS